MGAPMSLLQMQAVTKQYTSTDDVNGKPVTVLRGVELELDAGQSVAVVGPSGCGKSTLLHLMGALDRPTSGSITIGGQSLAELDEAALAELRSRQIGFVFQFHHLLPQCSVLENVLVPALPLGRDAVADAQARAQLLLERVGLADRMTHRPGQLSGGERQRVAVVRALVNQPALLLADEPTGALDRANAQRLVELLIELNESEQIALVMVTHAMDLAAHMQQVHELRDGKLSAADAAGATP